MKIKIQILECPACACLLKVKGGSCDGCPVCGLSECSGWKIMREWEEEE